MQCIVDFCDLQLFSGLAILISVFLSLHLQADPISTLDWQTIISLAWFSAITHLAGLTTLRSYFRFRAQHRTIRVVLIFMLILLLIAALIPTGFIDWGTPSTHYSLTSSPVVDYFYVPPASLVGTLAARVPAAASRYWPRELCRGCLCLPCC